MMLPPFVASKILLRKLDKSLTFLIHVSEGLKVLLIQA